MVAQVEKQDHGRPRDKDRSVIFSGLEPADSSGGQMEASPPKPQDSVSDENSCTVVASGSTPATTVGGTDDQGSGGTLDSGYSRASVI